MSRPAQRCGCGRPLHYVDHHAEASVTQLVAQYGPDVVVEVGEHAWQVPRHYIALHGLAAVDLPRLALQLGWRQLR